MADRALCISWGANVAGREERGLEVFNEAVGMYGKMQQDGRIESFDVCLLDPNGSGIQGYMTLKGTAAQLDAVREDEEFRRVLLDASMIVKDLDVSGGVVEDGIAKEMELYTAAIHRVPQMA